MPAERCREQQRLGGGLEADVGAAATVGVQQPQRLLEVAAQVRAVPFTSLHHKDVHLWAAGSSTAPCLPRRRRLLRGMLGSAPAKFGGKPRCFCGPIGPRTHQI